MPIAAGLIHGILTDGTELSWPDLLDGYIWTTDPTIKVLKKEGFAGPFPCFNCWISNPLKAKGLAAEMALFARLGMDLVIVGHSNGADIALRTAHRLIKAGFYVKTLIVLGAAIQPDVERNGILTAINTGKLGMAISYSSKSDKTPFLFPYGNCGRVGFTLDGKPYCDSRIVNNYHPSFSHSAYFDEENRNIIFGKLLNEIAAKP